jgi:hypothetical protein
MADLDDVIKLVQAKYPDDEAKQARAADLTTECWERLEPDVQKSSST